MVDTLQAFSGAVVGPLKRVLKKKGYVAIGAREIIMPNNYYPKKVNDDKNAHKVSKGLDKGRDFAEAIVDGKSHWLRIPLLSDAFYWLVFRPKTWEVIADTGKRFEVDEDECDGCGICEKLCPVGNITMDDLPRFGGACQSCMRCISFCPKGAIFLPDKSYMTYMAVKAKELILK
jgi:Pyruvate/2-oxoacid:ferredoxin oxidoreductase delta subunit